MQAIVDDADFALLSRYHWQVTKTNGGYYATTRMTDQETKRSRSVRMHRFLMGAKPEEQVDHINRNPLDNRRQNLRLCSVTQNLWNHPGRRGSSRFKGVHLHKP